MLNEETLTRLKIKNKKPILLFLLFTLISCLIFYFISQKLFASEAHDYATCGIPEAPPLSCVHCVRVCFCDKNGRCQWMWMKK